MNQALSQQAVDLHRYYQVGRGPFKQPVTLKATNFNCYINPMLKREVCGGDFETTIARSAYGMSFGIADYGLPDNIRLLIQIEAIKQ